MRLHWVFFLITALAAGSAFADTLELKDGRLLQGQYMGGSPGSVRWSAGGNTQVIPGHASRKASTSMPCGPMTLTRRR